MNLMQYLSVSGTLEGPREKFLSRKIGSSQGDFTGEGREDLAHPEPVALAEPAAREAGQGEFGFVDPLVIEPKPSGPGNHLELAQEETKPRDRDQVEVYSRISPTRVRVVRNDLAGSDLTLRAVEGVEQFRPSLIAEEPSISTWSERMRGRLEPLNRVSKWMSRRSWRWLLAFKSFWPVGIMAGASAGSLKVVPEKVAQETPEQMNSTELDEAIEMAKDYKTDVYVDGRVAWSYEEYASSVEEMVPIEYANDL
ncbi:MAG: hypothetical protein QF721_08720 [Verrucomicrobiota bacterium]|jgi:hypothetical protein|nr:hypothetical protein [Verrucomicrobiota bacterium]